MTPHVSLCAQTAAAYVLFYRRRMEGRPALHILDRSLSQSFAEEVRQRKARYQPEGGSHSEEGNENEGGGEERESKERKRSRNKVSLLSFIQPPVPLYVTSITVCCEP